MTKLTDAGKRLAGELHRGGILHADADALPSGVLRALNAAARRLRLPLEGDASLREAAPRKASETMVMAAYDYWRHAKPPGLFAGPGAEIEWMEGIINAALSARASKPTGAHVNTQRPAGNNADEWNAWLDEHRGYGTAYIAVQIAQALDGAALARPQPEAKGPVAAGVIGEIEAERRRQMEAEGWTPEHDDQHANGEMLNAAVAYMQNGAGSAYPAPDGMVPTWWPWDKVWWKPKDRRRDLVRAAALIVAEIERLDRASGASTTPPAEAKTPDAGVGAPSLRDLFEAGEPDLPSRLASIVMAQFWANHALPDVDDYRYGHLQELFSAALTPTRSAGEDDTGVREAITATMARAEKDNAFLEETLRRRQERAPQPPKAETPAGVGGDLADEIAEICAGLDPESRARSRHCSELSYVVEQNANLICSALRAALSTAPAAQTGDEVSGFVLVPREPTPEMERAFDTAYWAKAGDASSPTPTEHPDDGGGAFGYGYRAMRKAAALSTAPAARPGDEVERVRHVKRGTEYEVLGEAEAQVSLRVYNEDDPHGEGLPERAIYDGDKLTVYRDPKSGKLWCRFTDEFRDGRFVPAAAPAADGGHA